METPPEKPNNKKSQESIKSFFDKVKQQKQENFQKLKKKLKVDDSDELDNTKINFFSELDKEKKNKEKKQQERKIELQDITTEQRFVTNVVRLSLGGTATKEQSKDIIKNTKQQFEKIENEITQQRDKLKEIYSTFLFEKKCNCVYVFSHITESGEYVSTCQFCSRIKKWDPFQWCKYNLAKLGRIY
jgi:vacuolar-type H+-ATPase subunit I/STV1